MSGILPRGRDHLDEIGLGYFGHLARALGIAARLFGAGLACLIHGIVPGLFTHNASRAIGDLNRELTKTPTASTPPLLGAAEAEA